ncbi:MAG: hypothetical protein FWE54_03250 [Methanimicrococcus sp.]|nr:hypothetical protein [Methanimicrococcus sp.]
MLKEFKKNDEEANIIKMAAGEDGDETEGGVEAAEIGNTPSGNAAFGNTSFEKTPFGNVFDNMAFYSGAVKAKELPPPSDENLWKTLFEDIEALEAFIAAKIKDENGKVTAEEKKKAATKGELEEKEKGIEDIEKEIRRLNEDKNKTEISLKTEQAELSKKKKLVSDFEIILAEDTKKRNEKLKVCPILIETASLSRYRFNNIMATDVDDASDFLRQKKESLMSEESGLKSEKSSIEKIISQKEALLKAGKCPTCGQEIKAVTAGAAGTAGEGHPEHGTNDEAKRLTEIKIRLGEIQNEAAVNEPQAAALKDIQSLDKKIEKIRLGINTLNAEVKGKTELIEIYQKDLAENERQKTEWNARKIESDVSCSARKKDLEGIEKRLSALKEKHAEKEESGRLLSERKKEFSNAANGVLLDYKTLESEKKLSKEAQKRMEEIEKSAEEIEKTLLVLKTGLEKITDDEKSIKAQERDALRDLAEKEGILSKAEKLEELRNEKESAKIRRDGGKKAIEQQDTTIENLKSQKSDKEIKAKNLAEKVAAAGEIIGDGINGNGTTGDRTAGDGAPATAEEQKNRLLENIRVISEDIWNREQTRSDVDREIGMIGNEIKQLTQFEKELEILRNKTKCLSFVADDVAALEDMYRRIRSEMRSKNIEALDRLINDMFDLIYSNNSYSHLELDTDYNLKVHEKDGSVLEPKQLSGGERAIFNLALRCAIYRLLSYGFGENNSGTTSLPPLIFDEPTVFLDSGHIRQLIKLIEHMKEDGVGQIIVVSHDESLIDSADENFKVEKDPLTNASGIIYG